MSAIVGEARSGKEAVVTIEREGPDLALLDLQMPELDGIGVVRMLKKRRLPLIAFVTAFDEYAVRAFEMNAVDYLLKPVDKRRCARPSTALRNVSTVKRCGRIRANASGWRSMPMNRWLDPDTSTAFPCVAGARWSSSRCRNCVNCRRRRASSPHDD